MFGQNTFIGEKLKDLKAQLDRSYTFRAMAPSTVFKLTLKPAQNTTFSVNHALRWNNSNLITDWETVLTLNNYMGEMNSEIIARLQVPRPNYDIVGSKNSSSQNM